MPQISDISRRRRENICLKHFFIQHFYRKFTWGGGYFSPVLKRSDYKANHLVHLVPRLRMRGTLPTPPPSPRLHDMTLNHRDKFMFNILDTSKFKNTQLGNNTLYNGLCYSLHLVFFSQYSDWLRVQGSDDRGSISRKFIYTHCGVDCLFGHSCSKISCRNVLHMVVLFYLMWK